MSPVRDWTLYGEDWPEFSAEIRFTRAGGQCECEGECGATRHRTGRCPARHGEPSPLTGSKVVLTVAHLCHTPQCRDHVRAFCQLCHLNYDKDHHATTRKATR